MKEMAISVAQAARNFSDCVNRAHYQQIAYVLLKNGEPYARLIPQSPKSCRGKDLARILSELELRASEAKAWHRDLRKAQKGLKSQADKWR